MQSQTLGLNQEGGERRHGLCRGTGELSRQRWVCAHALAGNAGGSPPPRGAAAGDGVDEQRCRHCSPEDGHTQMRCSMAGVERCCQGLCLATREFLHRKAMGMARQHPPKQHNELWPWHWLLPVLEEEGDDTATDVCKEYIICVEKQMLYLLRHRVSFSPVEFPNAIPQINTLCFGYEGQSEKYLVTPEATNSL